MSALDIFLRIVPGAAGVGHKDRHHDAGGQSSREQPAEGLRSEEQTDRERRRHREKPRDDHFLQSGIGGDRDAALIIRSLRALHNTGLLPELPADLLDHRKGRAADRAHRKGGEKEGKHRSEQKPDRDAAVQDIDALQLHRLRIGRKKRESRERRAPDRKTLSHGGRRISHRVELIRDAADRLLESRHLRDAARIVRDRTIGVDSDRHGRGGEHADRGERNPVEAELPIRDKDRDRDQKDRDRRGAHADRDAGDDIGAGPGLRLARDLLHRLIVSGGIKLRHRSDQKPRHKAGYHRERRLKISEEKIAEKEGRDDYAKGRDIACKLKSLLRLIPTADEKASDNTGEQTEGRKKQRIEHPRILKVNRPQRQGRDQRSDIGLEKIRPHAGDIADIIADIIRDHSGISRIILRNPRLDLSDQVRSDIGGLGIDSSANPRKKRDGGSSEGKAGEHIHILCDEEDQADSQNAEARDAHPHDGAARKCKLQGLIHPAPLGRRGRADIGLRRGAHAEVSRQSGQKRSKHKGERTHPAPAPRSDPDQKEKNRHEKKKNPVFRKKEGMSTLGNRARDLLHPLIACLSTDNPLRLKKRESESRGPEERNQVK